MCYNYRYSSLRQTEILCVYVTQDYVFDAWPKNKTQYTLCTHLSLFLVKPMGIKKKMNWLVIYKQEIFQLNNLNNEFCDFFVHSRYLNENECNTSLVPKSVLLFNKYIDRLKSKSNFDNYYLTNRNR